MFCIEIHCVKLCKLISLEFIHLYFSRWQKKWSKEMVTKTGFMGAVHSRTRARRLVPETSALDHSATLPCLILFYCHCIVKIIACAPRKLLQSIVVELPGLQRRPPAIGCDDFVFYGSVVHSSSSADGCICTHSMACPTPGQASSQPPHVALPHRSLEDSTA